MPRLLMHGELQLGKRHQGHPKLQYKDTVQANIQLCHTKPKELEEHATDRPRLSGKPNSTKLLPIVSRTVARGLQPPEIDEIGLRQLG